MMKLALFVLLVTIITVGAVPNYRSMYEAQISASASDTGKLAIINFNEFQNEFQSRLGMNLEDADEELIRNMLDIIYLPKLFYLQNYVNNYAVIYD